MSEFSKLNGYDVKDKTARADIEKLFNEKVYHVENITTLRTSNFIENNVVQTAGYYEPNDGGNGLYKIVNNNSLLENGGSVINLNNNLKAVLIVENNMVNIRQFGAKGNGENDDTSAIINALNSGYGVYIPEGTFLFESQITIEEAPIIKCDGFLKYNGTEIDGAIIIGKATETNNKDIEIKLTTNKYNNNGYAGLVLKNINNSRISLKNINNFGVGCRLLSDDVGCCYNTVNLGYFFNNNVGLCLQSNNGGWTNENLFLNGNFKYSNQSDKTGTVGILLDSNDNYNCNNNTFIKPSIETIDTAIKILYGHSNKFEYIRSEDNTITAVISSNAKNNMIFVGNGDMSYNISNKTNKIISQEEKNFGNGLKIAEIDFTKDCDITTNKETQVQYIHSDKVAFMHSGGSTSDSVAYANNYELTQNYLIQMVQSKAIGIFIDTTKAKRFFIKKITELGYAGRFCLRCYDESQNVISSSNVSLDSFEGLGARNEINNTFMTSTNNPRDVQFILPDNVKSIYLGISKIGNNDIHIKSMEIYSDYDCKTSNTLAGLSQ